MSASESTANSGPTALSTLVSTDTTTLVSQLNDPQLVTVHFPPNTSFHLTTTMLNRDSPNFFSLIFLSSATSQFTESRSRQVTIPDHSPQLFSFIADYLRGYSIFPISAADVPPRWLPLSKLYENLRRDAHYYGLVKFEEECAKWLKKTEDPNDDQCLLHMDFSPLAQQPHPSSIPELMLECHLADVPALRKRWMVSGKKNMTYGPFPWKPILDQLRNPHDRDMIFQPDQSSIVDLYAMYLKPPHRSQIVDKRSQQYSKMKISKEVTKILLKDDLKPSNLPTHLTLRFHATGTTTTLRFRSSKWTNSSSPQDITPTISTSGCGNGANGMNPGSVLSPISLSPTLLQHGRMGAAPANEGLNNIQGDLSQLPSALSSFLAAQQQIQQRRQQGRRRQNNTTEESTEADAYGHLMFTDPAQAEGFEFLRIVAASEAQDAAAAAGNAASGGSGVRLKKIIQKEESYIIPVGKKDSITMTRGGIHKTTTSWIELRKALDSRSNDLAEDDYDDEFWNTIPGEQLEPGTRGIKVAVFGQATFVMAKTPFSKTVIPKFISIDGVNKMGWEANRPIWHGDKQREQNSGNEKAEATTGRRSRKRARIGSTGTPASVSASAPSPASVASAPLHNASASTTFARIGQPAAQYTGAVRQEELEDESDLNLNEDSE